MSKLILATTSPHRKRLFETLGIPFTCESSDVDEYHEGRPTNPRELVAYLSRLKAEAVAKNHDSGFVLGFDSVAYFDGKILEKPKSREEAFERLKEFSAEVHSFFTGIHLINLEGRCSTGVVETTISFRPITIDEINLYLDQDKNEMYKTVALGYDAQSGYSSTFPDEIQGSVHNVLWGLPIERIMPMLFRSGYELPRRK